MPVIARPVFIFGTWKTVMVSFTRTRLPTGTDAPADCPAALARGAAGARRRTGRAHRAELASDENAMAQDGGLGVAADVAAHRRYQLRIVR
jgi:hypothetical protein